MKNKHALVALAVAAISIFVIGAAEAQSNDGYGPMMGGGYGMTGDSGNFAGGGMMGGMGNIMQGNFVHDEDDTQWMRKYMNLTDEDFDEMAEHCPMMRR